jgi:integrase
MWDAGMRELTLQKRLGHASPESTRMYTKVSDRAVVADYRRALGLDTADIGQQFPEQSVRHAS